MVGINWNRPRDGRIDSLVPVEDEDGEDVEGCLVEEATRYLSLRHAVQDVLHQFIRDVDLYIHHVCVWNMWH